MKLDICINTAGNNRVLITELTDGSQYLPEGSTLTAKNRFEYNDTASIDIFRLNSTEGTTYTPAVIALRTSLKGSEIKLTKDGWFTAIHIVVPTQDWVYRELSKNGSIINTYNTVYFTDGKEIFTCTKGNIQRSSLDDILNETSTNTTISRKDSEYVSISTLQKQLTEAYTELLKNRMYNGGCKTNACEANRLVTAVNLIKHYVRHGQLAEAERIIEKVNYFDQSNNPIPNRQKDTKLYNDCGCK